MAAFKMVDFYDWLINKLESAWTDSGFEFVFNKKSICQYTFQVLHGIGNFIFNKAFQHMLTKTRVQHATIRSNRENSLEAKVINILSNIFTAYFNRFPTDESKLVLPCCFSKNSICNEVQEIVEKAEKGKRTVSSKTIMRVWNSKFKNVFITKDCRLGSCDTCSYLAKRLNENTRLPTIVRSQLQVKRAKHRRIFWAEHVAYTN